jgi:penicillin-binding protein 2
MLMLVLMMAILLGRLFYLQILDSENYQRQSRENRFEQRRIPSSRGLILDRHGRVLAENLTACELSISLSAHDADSTLLERVAVILDRPQIELLARIESARQAELTRAVLERDLAPVELLRLEERLHTLKGVKLRDWARRNYPYASLCAHMMGYVGEVGDAEILAKRGSGAPFFPGDLVGRSGAEQRWQKRLRGMDGKELFLVNARGTLLETVEFVPPVPGETLVLSLDIELTAVLDSALAAWGCGAGVVMDVRSGEVLAMASQPSYDPNLFTGGISTENWEYLSTDPGRPLFNRVLQATYAPASAYKPIVALAALENGTLNRLGELTPCFGGLQLGRRYFRCWLEQGHGKLDLEHALERSCDVWYYQVGEALGANNMARMARRFGLGSPTGLDLGFEASGLVPDNDYYDDRFGRRKWSRGLFWNIAIGQGELLVTPLQMARFYAGLANGSRLPVPHLLLRTLGPEGEQLVRSAAPSDLSLNAQHLQSIRRGLELVMHGTWGTARASALPGLRTAGKTGTVQNPHGEEHGWFCGYAPADDPVIAISLIIEHGEHGSDVAPIFRRLVEKWLEINAQSEVQP